MVQDGVDGTDGFAGIFAGIAQLVEHNLAKVGVAGSSPVSRSERVPFEYIRGGAAAWPLSRRLLSA